MNFGCSPWSFFIVAFIFLPLFLSLVFFRLYFDSNNCMVLPWLYSYILAISVQLRVLFELFLLLCLITVRFALGADRIESSRRLHSKAHSMVSIERDNAAVYWLILATSISSTTTAILYLFQKCCGRCWGNISSVWFQSFAESLDIREETFNQVTNLLIFPRFSTTAPANI